MGSEASIASSRHVRLVNWSAGTATSDVVRLIPGRAYSLWLPDDFQGASVSLQMHIVQADPNGIAVDVWDDFHNAGALATQVVSAGKFNYLPATFFCGADEVKFVSDATENTTPVGFLQMST